MKGFKRVSRIAAMLLAVAMLCGCWPRVIREDVISDGLPLIYPNEGVGRSTTVTLYFRLRGEPFLVPVTDTVTIRASEYEAEAVLEKLAQGPGVLLPDLTDVLPPDTQALKVSVEKDIAYITLSDELFGDESWSALDRKLSICAIVNSLCALSGISRVQVWDSVGKRLTGFQYGFETGAQQLLGPLGRQEDVVLTPKRLAETAFNRLIDEEYTFAYALFAQSEPGGGQKPSYAAFETQLKSIGKIESVTILSVNELAGGVSAEATVDITLTDRAGAAKKASGAVLQLIPGERNRIGYYSLIDALNSAQ